MASVWGDYAAWAGIVFCLSQSAMFSGLNLAFFSLSRLRLEVEVAQGNPAARTILALREDSNFLLTTILWGNVSINVLLTLLSDSVMAGMVAFVFSTVFITLFGEIVPQAYFSRNAMRMGALLAPVLRFYQWLLYPVAKPSAVLLDSWLGKEGINYFRETDLKSVIEKHIEAEEAEVDRLEGIGAVNFLTIDDTLVSQEGELIDPRSVITLPSKVDFPILPEVQRSCDDPFLQQVNASGHKWVILANEARQPLLVMDADGLLRAALFNPEQPFEPYEFCFRPLIIHSADMNLGDVLKHLKSAESLDPDHDGDIEVDVVLVWTEQPRIITGADILGRLLKGTGEVAAQA
ncbi:CNNM domain-containing protein [Pseudoalteromonas sp. OOF1S-7]|uniref:DUF21 domain-containing protein n=1 Tax=Pseudoalteromonas sp. OOF1S-7 TaxID=2917757 RepID=UPI001EF59A4D|nr:CNNM domain-containing protein [Pseudoalteromonas sp. OOF1S-7]MCG7537061.1 CNNM domain-containing protein [Pseudoalteromonas sp. OOF1S-7]